MERPDLTVRTAEALCPANECVPHSRPLPFIGSAAACAQCPVNECISLTRCSAANWRAGSQPVDQPPSGFPVALRWP